MKPFQIITISVFALLALVGLFLFATFKGFGGAKPLGNVMIWGTLSADALQPALNELKRNHKEFDKVAYLERNESTFDADLAEAIASGTGPDMIIITQEQLTAEIPKLSIIPYATIPERTYRDTYVPIYELFLDRNGTFGVPFVVDPLVLYYNRTLLASGGLAQPPTTWEAVVGLAPTLTRKSDTGVVSRSTVAFGTYENIPNARAIISLLLLQSGSQITTYGTLGITGALASGGSSAAYSLSPAESAVSFYTQFADPAKVVYSWNRSLPSARQAFTSGDSVFYVGFASEAALLKATNPNLDFDMAPVPQPQTAQTKTDYGLAYAFAIPKAASNPDGAYKTAQALTAKDELYIIAGSLGMAPAKRAFLTPQTNDIFASVYYPMAIIAKGWLSPTPGVTDAIFTAMITDVISGRSNVHDAIKRADDALSAAFSH
ncbi:MAG: extracellular solute-binding protein [Patescibacteria group bacterium]